MIGLLALLVVTKTGVLTTSSPHQETVNGGMVSVVLLLAMTGLVVALVVTKTGVQTTSSLHQAIVNGGTVSVVQLLAMIGLVALLVLPETGVLMIFNHLLVTVNGTVALVTEVVVLQTITTNEQAVGQETTKIGVLTTFNLRRVTVNGVMDNVVLHRVMIGLLALLVVTKTGAQTTSSLLREIVSGGEDSAVSLPGPVMTIRTVLTAMIIAIRTGTDVSVQQDNAVSQVPIVEMDKVVSGCAAKESANLAHYLKWL